jgi:hypothetical protein
MNLQTLGNGLRASAKSQINLMMTESPGLKQAEGRMSQMIHRVQK